MVECAYQGLTSFSIRVFRIGKPLAALTSVVTLGSFDWLHCTENQPVPTRASDTQLQLETFSSNPPACLRIRMGDSTKYGTDMWIHMPLQQQHRLVVYSLTCWRGSRQISTKRAYVTAHIRPIAAFREGQRWVECVRREAKSTIGIRTPSLVCKDRSGPLKPATLSIPHGLQRTTAASNLP